MSAATLRFISFAGCAATALASLATRALDGVAFYEPSLVTARDAYGPFVVEMPSLNAGLWAAANQTAAERPFSDPPHSPGVEWVLNLTAPAGLAIANMSNAAGVATLPTGGGFLGIAHGLGFAQCAAHCANAAGCVSFAYYEVSSSGGDRLCQYYATGFELGPQPFPSGAVQFAQGANLTAPATAAQDAVAHGLRSGTWLGGLGTGGYELRADGTFHLSTIRNQSPASEPWHGVVRDMVLAVAVGGRASVVRLAPFGGLPGVPEIVYSGRVPLARLQFLGLTVYAYSPLTPGATNLSNTPAVVFTMHASAPAGAALDATFAVLAGLGLRSDWRGASAGATRAPGAASRADCAASCVQDDACVAWQWAEAAGACLLDAAPAAQIALGANLAGVDAGHPGAFAVAGGGADPASVVFANRNNASAAAQRHNAIGEQGLFAVAASSDDDGATFTYGAASGASADALLATLGGGSGSPSAALHRLGTGAPAGAAGDLFAMASVSVSGLAPGANASLSVVHAWHYPRFFWYRDAFGGSDNGVRYAARFGGAADVQAALNLTSLADNLLAWQGVYAGLPFDVLGDAAFNLFAHARSSMWFLRDEEYRQWESLEFSDFLNPTNGDERHLNYFSLAPEAMRSQLRTMVAHARNADGMFFCVSVSCAGDAQFCASDPCPPADHPDDIAMFVIGLYELFALANDTAIVAELYPAVTGGLAYYAKFYDSTDWSLPYQVHETYDAVPLTPSITGEGNLGTSLYNSVNYLTALNCIAALADFERDGATAAQARAMLARATASVVRHLWQPGADAPYFAGDTLQDYGLFAEPSNGFLYHSSDSLHGQAHAYRFGFGDLLPRETMQLHQKFVTDDLGGAFGLMFSRYSRQNWCMSDHSNSALRLRWNDATAWDTALAQVRFWRDTRREVTRNAAVFMADTGMYSLLNYYGYALFFFHTLPAFAGQTANLPNRSIAFRPHFSAFSAAGDASVPVLLGGCLGTLRLSPAQATLSFAFLGEGAAAALSFATIGICQHVFAAGPYELLAPGASVSFALPAPCDTASPSSASTVASAAYCTAAPAVNTSAAAQWAQQPLEQVLPGLSRDVCLRFAEAHHLCGYEWNASSGACSLVPGLGCFLVDSPPPGDGAAIERGFVTCDYAGSGYSPPTLVNASSVAFSAGRAFGGGFAPLDSPVFSAALQDLDACRALAARQQACGFLWAPRYAGPQLGSCGPQALVGGCCVACPSAPGQCAAGASLEPAVWGAEAVLGIFTPVGTRM